MCKEGNTSNAVQLGIKDAGIFVFSATPPTEEQEGQELVQGFEWRSIQKLCFSKQFFSLGCLSSEGKPLKLKFKMQDKK